jgi:hypothetical protein
MTLSKTDFAIAVDDVRSYLGPKWSADANEVLRAHGALTANPDNVPEGIYLRILQAMESLCLDRGVPVPPSLRSALKEAMHSDAHAVRPDGGGVALRRQEGGAHYKDLPIQPVEYIHANKVGYFEGNVIKYVTRWRVKGGLEDLRKARHYLDLLIELEGKL